MSKTNNPLWTRDFTILTLGSLVSMLGNALTSFAMCLLVLDYTDSSLLYAIFIGTYTVPQIIVPIFSGAILDRYSRKRTIYTLDFISVALYASAAIVIHNFFSFSLLAVYCFVIGCIHSIYMVAYQSLYPLLVTEGNLSKAYSISSVLETMSAVMIPVSTLLYKTIGMEPLLWINVGCFFVAACVETRIRADEHYIELQRKIVKVDNSVRRIWGDIREGFQYLWSEKGLLFIGIYFTIQTLTMGASTVVALPYFKSNFPPNGEYLFMIVSGMIVVGRAVSGLIHYNIKLPVDKKFKISVIVCILAALLQAFYLFSPIPIAMMMCLIAGIFDNTNYTIRASATQSYVPDHKKGRFNGAFNMLSTSGTLAGQLIAGVMAAMIPSRFVLMILMLLNALSVIFVIRVNRKTIEPIYNTQH